MSDAQKSEFDTGSSGDPTGPPPDQKGEFDTGSSTPPVDPNSSIEPPPPPTPETATIGGIMFTLAAADETGAKSGSGVDDSGVVFTVTIVDDVATVTDSSGAVKTYTLNEEGVWAVKDTGATTGGRRSRRRSRRQGGSRKKRRGGSKKKKRKGSKKRK